MFNWGQCVAASFFKIMIMIIKRYARKCELAAVFKLSERTIENRVKYFDIGRKRGYLAFTSDEFEKLIMIDFIMRQSDKIMTYKKVKEEMANRGWI